MNKIILTFALIAIFTSACTIDPCMTKGQFLAGYETLTEKVAENHEDYTKKDWEGKDEQMDHFVDQCYKKYKEKLTDDEQKEFWVKYFAYKYNRHGRNVISAIESDIREFELEIDGQLEDLFDNPEEDLKDIFREVYGDDIEEALDDFKEGLDDIADKIKEWLEEGE